MNAILLVGLACVSSTVGSQQVLDSFQYPNSQQAAVVWKAAEGTPPVEVVTEGGRQTLCIHAPFASDSKLDRVVIDRIGKWNLTAPSYFVLELRPQDADAFGHVTLYFHSKSGWYAQGKQLHDNEWQQLVFSKDAFGTEDHPVGWDKVDQIRIALWKGPAGPAATGINSHVLLGKLTAQWHQVAVVVPDTATRETKAGRDAADRIVRLLQDVGVACDQIKQSALQRGSLGRRSVAVLPYNPTLSDADYDLLQRWVKNGGKLFACYSANPQLLRILQLKNPKYYRPPQRGGLAAIELSARGIPGMPRRVRQDSWNITDVRPAERSGRVIGRWLDKSGRPTGHAALVLTKTGAYFTHIILNDDPAGMRAMLLALLGKLAPAVWSEAAASAIDRANQIGDCHGGTELAAHVRAQLTPALAKKLDQAAQLMTRAQQALAKGDGFEALQAAKQCRDLRVDVFLRAQPSPTVEGRAWWNHSGTGAYPGDWDRTCRELAAAGFNMVLPNMLWGGSARYASDVLPRSRVVQKYGDQIAQCVAAGKKYGIQVHVWKVNWNLGHEVPKEYVEKLRRAGRLQVTYDGKPMNWLNPAHPKNFQLELDSLLEVVRKYDVDGIHFDYIRYPNGTCDFSDYSHHKFEQDTGIHVANWPRDCYSGSLKKAYTDWRCQQITRLVEAVHREAKKIRPNIKISAAVFGAYPACRESVAQDWPLWIRKGYLDFVCPMDYTGSDEYFTRLIKSQLQLVGGRIPIYPGIGATSSRVRLTPDRVVGQIDITRRLHASGFTIFNLTESTAKIILPAVAVGAGRNKAKPQGR